MGTLKCSGSTERVPNWLRKVWFQAREDARGSVKGIWEEGLLGLGLEDASTLLAFPESLARHPAVPVPAESQENRGGTTSWGV